MADLKGKVAIVTGASRGVGRGIAQGLGEAGCTVYVTGRTSSAASPPDLLSIEATAAEVDALGGRGIPVRVDHEDDAAIAALVARVATEQGRLDVLVNNVFRTPNPPVYRGGFWTHPVAIWDDMVGIGCRAHYVASVHAAPLMVAQGSGLIVNISSSAGSRYRLSVSYGTGKAAVDRMARDMAEELRPHGVAAVSLWPGVVRTEFLLAEAEAEAGRMRVDLSAAQSPRFTGRAVAALARDPDVMEQTGLVYEVADLAKIYRFRDLDD